MKHLIKLFLKTFLVSGLCYSILFEGSTMLFGHAFDPQKFTINFIVFGIFITITLIVRLSRLKKAGINIYSDKFLTTRKLQVVSTLSKEDLIKKLRANRNILNHKIAVDAEGFEFKTEITYWSWGEKVRVNVQAINETENAFEIISRPSYKLTLFDWGVHYENVSYIENILTSA